MWRQASVSHGIRAKYAFVKAHRSEFDMARMCRLLEVSRYYSEATTIPLYAQLAPERQARAFEILHEILDR